MNRPTDRDRPARPGEVRLFRTVADLSPALWASLEARPADLAARAAGAAFDPTAGFTVSFMSGEYLVDPVRRAVTGPADRPVPDFQTGMVLVAYLTKAQDLGRSGRLVTGRELPGGEMFFRGPHSLATEPVTARFGRDPEGLLARAAGLGALPGGAPGAGYSFTWRVLPNITVGCVFHPADDEFPAEATWLFDAYSHYHLPLDSLWGLINVLAETLGAAPSASGQ